MAYVDARKDNKTGYVSIYLCEFGGYFKCNDINILEKLLSIKYNKIDIFHQLTRVKERKYKNNIISKFYSQQNYTKQEKRLLYKELLRINDVVNFELYNFLANDCRNNDDVEIKKELKEVGIGVMYIDVNELINNEKYSFIYTNYYSDDLLNPKIDISRDILNYEILKYINNLTIDMQNIALIMVDNDIKLKASKNKYLKFHEITTRVKKTIIEMDEKILDIENNENYKLMNLNHDEILKIYTNIYFLQYKYNRIKTNIHNIKKYLNK